jgi:hypothetical protein
VRPAEPRRRARARPRRRARARPRRRGVPDPCRAESRVLRSPSRGCCSFARKRRPTSVSSAHCAVIHFSPCSRRPQPQSICGGLDPTKTFTTGPSVCASRAASLIADSTSFVKLSQAIASSWQLVAPAEPGRPAGPLAPWVPGGPCAPRGPPSPAGASSESAAKRAPPASARAIIDARRVARLSGSRGPSRPPDLDGASPGAVASRAPVKLFEGASVFRLVLVHVVLHACRGHAARCRET